mgnify:CR=1 FL=1|jgi:hypothetical protein
MLDRPRQGKTKRNRHFARILESGAQTVECPPNQKPWALRHKVGGQLRLLPLRTAPHQPEVRRHHGPLAARACPPPGTRFVLRQSRSTSRSPAERGQSGHRRVRAEAPLESAEGAEFFKPTDHAQATKTVAPPGYTIATQSAILPEKHPGTGTRRVRLLIHFLRNPCPLWALKEVERGNISSKPPRNLWIRNADSSVKRTVSSRCS